MLEKKDIEKESDVMRTDDAVKNDVKENAVMRMNRRTFVKIAAGAAAAIALGKGLDLVPSAEAAVGTPNLTKYVDPLISAIPVLQPDTTAYPGKDYYEIYMAGSKWQFHSQLPVTQLPATPPTTWGYGSNYNGNNFFIGYLGPTIEATSGKPVVVKYINKLPTTSHPVQASIDPTVPDPMMYPGLMPGRATPHLHGGFTDPRFDGHPHSWFTADGKQGSHYGTLPGALTNESIYEYSNQQLAAMLWYHDHAMGITRLNAYAGLAALYFVRDQYDTGKKFDPITNPAPALNLPAVPYEIPLVIQDKQFNPDGSLFYPTLGVTAVHPIWMPEFFGDTPVVNGKAYPFLNVEPRRYRFRIVNGSQARFYNMWFNNPGVGPVPLWLIGMEQSLLPSPVQLTKLLIAPGERADVIIDFSQVPAGTVLTMMNNAKAPYPGGKGGFSQIMQFNVNQPLIGTDNTTPPANLLLPAVSPLATAPFNAVTGIPTGILAGQIRQIIMKETLDPVTGAPIHVRLNEKWFNDPVYPTPDETPAVNSTEVWQFVNLTVDAHPMHLHLVKFQVLNRQAFNAAAFTTAYLNWVAGGRVGAQPDVNALNAAGTPVYLTGVPTPPPKEEMGWKDTVKSYPGEIVRIITKFELPPGVTPPAEYVYHCHILEHEENEMMRPFQVV